ncbi:MAG TPA: DUF167 family protein [Parvibaculum sp.]
MPSSPFRAHDDGIAISLKVTPKAAQARIDGVAADAEGRAYLRVRVTEAPEKGKANEAVAKLVAKALGVPKSAVEIASGETGRLKTVHVRGAGLEAKARALVDSSRGRHEPIAPGGCRF